MERDPIMQEVMGWRVAASLFLMAAGAGAYLIGFVFSLMNPAGFMALSKLAMILTAPLVLVGGLLLLCDMGQRREFYRVYLRPGTSWMSRGALIVTLFFLFDLIHLFAGLWPATALLSTPGAYWGVGIIASILAILSLVYTGFLLGAVKAISFWSASYLSWLFFFSGLSTGAMAISVLFSIYKLAGGVGPVESLTRLACFNFIVIILEAVVLGAYLGAMRSRAATSVKIITRGKLATVFWGGVVGFALVLPFVMEAFKVFVPFTPVPLVMLAVFGGFIGLIGGYMLRHIVVYGGTRILLNVQGQLVSPPPEKYETKAIESAYQTFQKA